MKNIILATLLIVALATNTSCKKDSSQPGNTNYDLPATPAPAGLTGNWSSGFGSMLQLYDAYTGDLVGPHGRMENFQDHRKRKKC